MIMASIAVLMSVSGPRNALVVNGEAVRGEVGKGKLVTA